MAIRWWCVVLAAGLVVGCARAPEQAEGQLQQAIDEAPATVHPVPAGETPTAPALGPTGSFAETTSEPSPVVVGSAPASAVPAVDEPSSVVEAGEIPHPAPAPRSGGLFQSFGRAVASGLNETLDSAATP